VPRPEPLNYWRHVRGDLKVEDSEDSEESDHDNECDLEEAE
jgi:hypothetical protein